MTYPQFSNTAQLPSSPCFLNGEFTPLCDARISVMDRGFIFGDGVYEVVPVYAGRLFRFDQHMARLSRSLGELRMANPLSVAQWHEIASTLVGQFAQYQNQAPEQTDQLIYIQVTRGVALREHVMPAEIAPTVFVTCSAMKPVPAEQRARGVACVTADDFRWKKAHIKTVSLLGAVFARQLSFDAGALETVMFRDDYLSEAAASNVWVVKGGKLIGPPKNNLVLEGVRYGLFEQLCQESGIPFELRPITRAEVWAADELLLSSATKEVLAITQLDGQTIGQGTPGPIYTSLYAQYQAAKRSAANLS